MKCELCGYSGQMLPKFPAKEVFECPRCGLIFYRGNTASDLYSREYFEGGEYHDYRGDERVIRRNFRKQIRRLLELVPSGRLYEIGCAYGFFLDQARAHWDVSGIDVTEEGIAHAREALRLPVECGDFLDSPENPGAFDLICMWDTIEHLPHPVRTIEKATRALKPGGALVITTGDIGSLVARWRGERWRQIHPPTHLYYFSRKTLTLAIEKAGLSVDSIDSVGYWRSLRSMLYGIFALGKKRTAWIYRLLTAGGRLDLPVYSNLYDIMVMVAVKTKSAAAEDLREVSRSLLSGP